MKTPLTLAVARVQPSACKADPNGHSHRRQRVLQPVSLVGGFLQGFDERRGESRTFAVHRITSVALVEEDDAPSRA